MPHYASVLERRITRRVGRAIADFGLIEEGDRILVGVSGGKDSIALLRVPHLPGRRSPVRFTLVAGTLDQGNAGFDPEPLRAWFLANGYEQRIVRQDAYDLDETLLLNQLFGGKTRTMAPKRRSDDGRHVVVRPLAYVWEQDLTDYAAEQGFPVTPCGCPMYGSSELQRPERPRAARPVHLEKPEPGSAEPSQQPPSD